MEVYVAIIEDEDGEARAIEDALEKASVEKDGAITFRLHRFKDAIAFLTGYKPMYDIVFMDIGLPGMDGFKASKKLREIDKYVLLIFVTSMQRFALAGYEVSAFDFVVKPVKYGNFRMKLFRALEKLDSSDEMKIKVPSTQGARFIPVSTIKYVEIMNHDLVFHTTEGNVNSYGTLKKIEELLPPNSFAKCNSCYLVNLRYVTKIKEFTAFVGGDELKISHAKKKEFLQAIAAYMAGNV